MPKANSYYLDSKKDKNSTLIKNWRAIPLINVDVKVPLYNSVRKNEEGNP